MTQTEQENQDRQAFFSMNFGNSIIEDGGNIGTIMGIMAFPDAPRGRFSVFNKCSSNEPYWGSDDLYSIILKPLSEITDEDAIEVAKLSGLDVEEFEGFISMLQATNSFMEYMGIARLMPFDEAAKISDFLRRKGYLIPFLHYTVEKIIALKWAVCN